MPLREDLLNPIIGENPSGADLRYDPVYDKIKEARRQEDDLNQGAWQHERKVADYPLVIKLAQEAIATKSKDLQLAVWLTEALVRTQGFGGLRDGLNLLHGLLDKFWDTLYPELEDGDAELRAAPLEWISLKMEDPLGFVPLVADGYGFFKHKESRLVGFEDQVKGEAAIKAREKQIKEGKLAPEVFEKAFFNTPKAFYTAAEKNLDESLEVLSRLGAICEEKFGDLAPSYRKLTEFLREIRRIVHGYLEKKREIEPDPVEEKPPEPAAEQAPAAEAVEGGAAAAPALAPAAPGTVSFTLPVSAEPADRRDALAGVAAAAQYLRKREPHSPASYLMLRGLRWGELRAAAELSDPALLEAPPTEVRRQLKALALANKWADVLEVAEQVMALPCGRAWLDLQRYVVEACVALGESYRPVAVAIRSELKALISDVPQLLEATLTDDTPAANPETRTWIGELMQEASGAAAAAAPSHPVSEEELRARWQKKFADSFQLAKDALRSGQEQKAFEIMQREVDRQRSGRGRFYRKMQFVELCSAAGKEAIAQPIIEELLAAIEAHKLEDWEERSMLAGALHLIMTASKKISGDAKEKQKLFDRICRLDPVRAITIG